jgi:hypothetical protein
MMKVKINNINKSSGDGKAGGFMTVFLLLFFMGITGLWADDPELTKKEQEQCAADIIGAIGKLESNRDPKCHATATRLENFMYGTKLTAEARFSKVKLQKQLLLQLWKNASNAVSSTSKGKQENLVDYFKRKMSKILKYSRKPNGDIVINMTNKDSKSFSLAKRDIDHYSSIAYALRAILALQQEAMLQSDINLVALDQTSISSLKGFLDIFTLAVLQEADPEMGKKFRNTFTETMIGFAYEVWKYAENIAKSKKHRFILEEDVHEMWNSFVPFEVNEYEDVTFFPKLGRPGSLTIESYDFDAFRDICPN